MTKPSQLIRAQKNKTMKRLQKCDGKKKTLQKACHSTKNYAALKKEILCLKRHNENLKLQLQEQKLDFAALNRKCLHFETEINQLQLTNSTLKEENRNYEKLIATAEPNIRSCMTRLVETSQTLAGLQMVFNRNRSQQQLSKISGSLSKTQSKSIFFAPKNVSKHNRKVNNVAPRREQAVRPMVQGLQIFTNLTIPLQRISLPSQTSRSHNQVPVVETPQESETVNIPVTADRPNSVSYGKHRRNLHYRKNLKSIPKRYVTKKDPDPRCPKREFKRAGSASMAPAINFDSSASSESDAEEAVESYLKPIVLIRDYFNVPSSKKGKHGALDRNFTKKTVPSVATDSVRRISVEDPLEGTSTMFLSCNSSIESSRPSEKSSRNFSNVLQKNEPANSSDSDSDLDVDEKLQINNETKANLNPMKTEDCDAMDVSDAVASVIVAGREGQSLSCQVSSVVEEEVSPNTDLMARNEQAEESDLVESVQLKNCENGEVENSTVSNDAEMCPAASEV